MSLLYFYSSLKLPILKNMKGLSFINKNIYFISTLLTVTKEQYYVVVSGRIPGVYFSWEECKEQIHGYPKQDFKKFTHKEEALDYLHKKIIVLKESDSVSGSDIQLLEKTYKNFTENLINPTSSISAGLSTLQDCKPPVDKLILYDPDGVEESDSENEWKQIQSSKQIKEKELTIDADGYLVIYTDGACRLNGTPNAVAGLGVYFGPQNPLNASLPLEGKLTCVRAELCAAVLALQIARREGFRHIKIVTDSQLLIYCSTKWMKKWKNNNWLNYNGQTVANLDDLMILDKLNSELDVKWVHVRGHSGVPGNEAAHLLATKGTKEPPPHQ